VYAAGVLSGGSEREELELIYGAGGVLAEGTAEELPPGVVYGGGVY
jgi:hypothetical protein